MSAGPELQKLAHTLGVGVERLDMVRDLPADELRGLRSQIAEALFQAGRPAFARVAAVSKAVPTALVAKLSEAALPPLLAARTTELLEPARAADIVGRVSAGYLADVSAAMDAGRAPDVVAAIPPERVARVGAELARRGEWVVMGGFVSVVSDESLRAAVTELDGDQLLRIGFVVDDRARLDDIGAMLTDRQLDELLAAAAEHGLWVELAQLREHLAPPRAERLARRFAAAPDDVRAAFASAGVDPRRTEQDG